MLEDGSAGGSEESMPPAKVPRPTNAANEGTSTDIATEIMVSWMITLLQG